MLRSSIKSLGRAQGIFFRDYHHNSRLLASSRPLLMKTLRISRGNLTSSLFTLTNPNSSDSRGLHLHPSRFSPPSEQSLDRSLHRLDVEIRRTGRINRREIEEILQDVRELNSVTSSQSLMIIRCCGELVPEETFENRTKLVQEVWKTMENLKVPMDISHYNALLRVYLENEHKFNPSEFLQQLGSKGLEPNRVTYQRLIARFCQDGDIDGASTILQHMKEKQLPINVHVFNALILGHAQTGDMESAEGIISVMKQAGLEPNDDTYATLMRGYARKGDIENIQRIVKDCQEKDIFLVDRDFLEVIYTLAAAKREDLVPQILPLLKRHAGFNQEATNIILRLINIGEVETAFKLLKEMPRSMRQEDIAPSGNFFIRQLVASLTPPEKIIKYCQEMISLGLHKHALVRACEFSLQLKQFEKAFEFLETLHESGFPIRQHYFWPFFASSTSEKDVYNGLKCMAYLEMTPTVETLRDYVIPALLGNAKSSESFEFVLEKLAGYTKIPLATIVPAALQYVLQRGQMAVAANFAMKYRVKFNHIGIRRALVDAYLKSDDSISFVKIVGSAGLEGDGREAVGQVLMELLDSLREKRKVPYLLPVLRKLLENGLGLSNSSLEWIQNNLGEELTPEVSNILLQLVSGDLTPNAHMYNTSRAQSQRTGPVPYEERTTSELESLLEGSISYGRTNTKGIRKALLISYIRDKDVEKAEKLMQELESENFVMTPGIYALLLEMYCQADNLDKAQEVYKELSARDISFTMDDLKLLKYALLLVSNDKIEECIEFLKATSRDEARQARGAQQVALVWKILNTLAEKGNVEKVKEVFTILHGRGLTPINNVVLGPRVKAYLVNDDLEGALTEFETCVNEYSVTPWKRELFCRFIKAEDADRLQRVMDLSTKQHGEVNSLYDLVFAFLECGKVRQAKKILETPGLRARNEKLEITCQKYLEEDRVPELEQLVDITRDIFNIDRNTLYFYLLKAYCKQGNADKALSVWTSLQEENIQASPDLLIYLADFLRASNQAVPFVVPEKKKESLVTLSESNRELPVGRKEGSSTNRILKEFRNNLELNNLDEALKIKQTIEAQGNTINVQDSSTLIAKMTRAERLGEALRLTEQMFQAGFHPYPGVLKVLLAKLAQAGEVDKLNELIPRLSEELKLSAQFNSQLCVAHVNAGRGEAYFNKYIKGEAEAVLVGEKDLKDFSVPISASNFMLKENPELLPQYEELASKMSGKGDDKLHNALWIYYMTQKDIGKAKEMWETRLKDQERILFRSIMVVCRKNKDEPLARELGNQILPSQVINSSSKGVVLSCIIDTLCWNEKPEEALEVFNKYLNSAVTLEDVHTNTLTTLRDKLQEKNIDFPHEIPQARTNRKNRDKVQKDSSESDSSDSDKD